MYTSTHFPAQFRIQPTAFENLVDLQILPEGCAHWQQFPSVRMPMFVQEAIANATLEGLQLEALGQNAVAARGVACAPIRTAQDTASAASLARSVTPQYVVLSARLKDGTLVQAAPESWSHLRRDYVLRALALEGAAAAAIHQGHPWVGAVLSAMGVLVLSEVELVPKALPWGKPNRASALRAQ